MSKERKEYKLNWFFFSKIGFHLDASSPASRGLPPSVLTAPWSFPWRSWSGGSCRGLKGSRWWAGPSRGPTGQPWVFQSPLLLLLCQPTAGAGSCQSTGPPPQREYRSKREFLQSPDLHLWYVSFIFKEENSSSKQRGIFWHCVSYQVSQFIYRKAFFPPELWC